jgi:hypothetical protein
MYYGAAGVGSVASDYEAAYSAYLADHEAWLAEKAQYDADEAAYQQAQAVHYSWTQQAAAFAQNQQAYNTWMGMQARYLNSALPAYRTALATWQAQVDAAGRARGAYWTAHLAWQDGAAHCTQVVNDYRTALSNWQQQQASVQAEYRRQRALIEQRFSAARSLPAGTVSVTQAQHDQYQRDCDNRASSVPLDSRICVLAMLPITRTDLLPHPGSAPTCNPGPEPQNTVADPGPRPVEPAGPGPAPLRPGVSPEPAVPPVPDPLREEPVPPGEPTAAEKRAENIKYGAIGLAAVGGLYAVYRIFRRK